MTCIIGLEENGKAYVGADSMQVSGIDNSSGSNKKIFRVDGFIFAHTGSCKGSQIVKYLLDIPTPEEIDERFMFTKIAEPMRLKMKEAGYSEIKDNQESHNDEWIIAYKDQVYKITCDWEAKRFNGGLIVSGCGGDYAKGVMLALKDLEPKERIKKALEIASQCSVGVGPPFYVWETK